MRLGPLEDVGVHARRLLGRGVREELDLVELVAAQQAAGVGARRAGLAAEARRVGAEPHAAASASSRTSSRAIDVSGTSAVGMAHRSSRSMWYASSANFGSCPVLTIVSVRTSVGGRISS